MNTTFQVDMWTSDDDGAFYAHVRVANPNPHPIDAYWWSNIGVPVDNSSRVLYSDSPIAVARHSNLPPKPRPCPPPAQ